MKRQTMRMILVVTGMLMTAGFVTGVKADSKEVFGSKNRRERAFTGQIYEIPQNTSKLKRIRWGTPIGTLYTTMLDVPKRDFRDGFPGISERMEWFAIRYKARFTVLDDGKYRFRLRSDDGSILRIDGREVIDNDGAHPAKTRNGSIRLSRGEHEIEVDYFQGPRYSVALQLWVKPPGGDYIIFRTDVPLGRGDGPFGSVFGNNRMIEGRLFAVNRGFRLDDMDRLGKPLGILYVPKLDVPVGYYNGGFPFITERSDWFAIRYMASFNTPVGGRYRFSLMADDGAMLYVNGRLVVDNGGMHAPRTRTGYVELDPGEHTVRVDYFQASDRVGLQLMMTPPNGTEMLFVPGTLDIAVPEPVSDTGGGTVGTASAAIVNASALVDFVSQAEKFTGDGFPDTHVQVSIPGGVGTIQWIRMINENGFSSLWDTVPANNGWAMAVVVNGLRQNRPDGSVMIPLTSNGLVADLYIQDNGSVSAGLTTYRIDVGLSDGRILSYPVNRLDR